MKILSDNYKEKKYRKKGIRFLNKRKLENAYECFLKSISINDSTENNFNLALSLMSLNRYLEAEKYFRKVHEQFPENEINSLALAECLLMQKKWKNSEKIYAELVKRNLGSKVYTKYLKRAKDVVAREKYVKSKELFESAQNELQKKNNDKALKKLKEAAEFDPENPNIMNNIGSILISRKMFSEAYGYFEKAVILAPNNKKFQKNVLLAKMKLRK
ncbi:MAG: tetratricopeptide repeat protein [Armatimonadetes bacterium]|nr:tetratricopeptide repeat protein [Armatimonadota bacterium]